MFALKSALFVALFMTKRKHRKFCFVSIASIICAELFKMASNSLFLG